MVAHKRLYKSHFIKMRKPFLRWCFLLTLVILAIFGYFNSKAAGSIKKVCYKQRCLKVQIAATPIERERGLMFRENLPKDQGMLFVFDQQDVYGFWMKNTYIPLDIVWIDENLRVVYIKKGAQPCLADSCTPIEPDQKALYVLEGNSGFVDELGFSVGSSLNFVY